MDSDFINIKEKSTVICIFEVDHLQILFWIQTSSLDIILYVPVRFCFFLFILSNETDANSNNLKKRFHLDLFIFNIQVPEVDLIKWQNLLKQFKIGKIAKLAF